MSTQATVSAIVPARNEEATIARAVESLAAQPEIAEIIVINDQSTDSTAVILKELAARIPRLRVLETNELPDGWIGKNYALSLGAARAGGEWLLFTDADAVHLPGSTAYALRDAAASGAALVSYSPQQETRTWWERAMIPFVYCRLAEKFSYAEVSDRNSPAAAANGQYLLIRRDAYDSVGGHRSVAGELLEDVTLARRVKQAGFGVYFAPGESVVRVRMYRSFGAMWQGWTKNLYPLMGGSIPAVLKELVAVVPWIPLVLIALAPVHRALPVLGLVLLAGRHATYAAVLRRNHFPISHILYYGVGMPLYSVALGASAWRYTRRSVVWKGRTYRLGTSRR